MSQTYSIYEAKAKLSEIIRIIKKRRRVVITERGVPVAEVIPYRNGDKDSLEQRVARLTEIGAVIPAPKRFRATPVRAIPGATKRFLIKDRD